MRRLLSKLLAVGAVVAGLALGSAGAPALAQGASGTHAEVVHAATHAHAKHVRAGTAARDAATAAPADWWF